MTVLSLTTTVVGAIGVQTPAEEQVTVDWADSHGKVIVVGPVTEVVKPPKVFVPGVRVVAVLATTV